MGSFAKSGRFIIDPVKFGKSTFSCPDLTGFPLKAYVSRTTPQQLKKAAEPALAQQ